jgi:hypothetical protein
MIVARPMARSVSTTKSTGRVLLVMLHGFRAMYTSRPPSARTRVFPLSFLCRPLSSQEFLPFSRILVCHLLPGSSLPPIFHLHLSHQRRPRSLMTAVHQPIRAFFFVFFLHHKPPVPTFHQAFDSVFLPTESNNSLPRLSLSLPLFSLLPRQTAKQRLCQRSGPPCL